MFVNEYMSFLLRERIPKSQCCENVNLHFPTDKKVNKTFVQTYGMTDIYDSNYII